MIKWKLPPIEKIYEAFSVLVDKRYEIRDKGKAIVTSSEGNKHYPVTWNEEKAPEYIIRITSNDNASRWQGYTGYPIIAILMISNIISFNHDILHYFKDIPWHSLNKAHNNDHAAVVEFVLEDIKNKKDVEKIRKEVNNIYSQLSKLILAKPEKEKSRSKPKA